MKSKNLFFFILFLCSSCALITTHYEQPSVSVKHFQIINGKTSSFPGFMVTLQVINPNRDTLPVRGIFYAISLGDQRIISGVTNSIPPIKGYGQADIVVSANVNLLGGILLVNRFLQGNVPSMEYTFTAKVDVGKMMPPVIVKEKGRLFSLEKEQHDFF